MMGLLADAPGRLGSNGLGGRSLGAATGTDELFRVFIITITRTDKGSGLGSGLGSSARSGSWSRGSRGTTTASRAKSRGGFASIGSLWGHRLSLVGCSALSSGASLCSSLGSSDRGGRSNVVTGG